MSRQRIRRVRPGHPIPGPVPPEKLGFTAEPVTLSEPERDDAGSGIEPEDQEDEKPPRLRRIFYFTDEEDLFDMMGF